MANPLQIKTRIEVVKERMASILRKLATEYNSGVIKSPAELHHRVYRELEAFYNSIGKNTFKPIKAWGPPYSDDHNTMVRQLRDDFLTLYQEVIYMTDDLKKNFEQVELERQSFLARLSKIESLVKNIDLNIREADYTVVFRDNFVDYEHYRKDATELPAANLSADEGLLTLARVDSERFNEYATITIIEGNGFPGNTHIVRSVGDTLKFEGQEELHINLADILDGNTDTWFEYELFELTDRTRQITQGMDFEYKEAIEWITSEREGLRCVFQIDLPKPKTMNWLSLSPFIPSDKGSSPAIIEKIMVTDEKGNVSSMGFGESFDGSKGYLFPRQKCRTITIYLRQPVAYETTVGHFYFKQVNKNDVTAISQRTEQDGIRIHGPVPSVKNLGVTYDTGKQQILYPVAAYGDKIKDEDEKKRNLFDIPATPSNVQAGLEQVSAYRYVIGLRDVLLASYMFEPESEYVSEPFYSSTPIKAIELDVDVDIPAQFPQDQDWLEYYISVDDGQNWHRIYPRNVYKAQAKTKYLFNSGMQKSGRIDEIGYIESLTEIHQVQLKIILKRPEDIKDAEYYTPIVYGYELHALTAEELI